MSPWKKFGLGLFTAVWLLDAIAGSALAQCFRSVEHNECATEWSSGGVINLGGLPGFTSSYAWSINDAGQVVGYSIGEGTYATEWSGGNIINLGGLPGFSFSLSTDINNAGQVIGNSFFGNVPHATEWSGGSIIDLGGLSGFSGSTAEGINDIGQVVGFSLVNGRLYATEWSGGGNIVNLGALPGATDSEAFAVNKCRRDSGNQCSRWTRDSH
jgi:probable HAF family extracellular repeat protein